MFPNTRLIVTTRGRVDFQPTLEALVPKIRKLVTLVCWPDETEEHRNRWKASIGSLVPHPAKLDNIDAIRHWCIEFFKEDYIIFMDDNIQFSARVPGDGPGPDNKHALNGMSEGHYKPKTITLLQTEMFTWMHRKLSQDKYGIVGISQQAGNNHIEEDEVENGRIFAFWGISKPLYNKVKDKYDVSPYRFKGDFYTMLFMLTNGYPNIISYRFAFNKAGGANNKGGCSTYRDEEMMIRESKQLVKDFPGLVKLTKKRSKTWKGVGDYITDVTVSWKKAYELGKKKQRNIGFGLIK